MAGSMPERWWFMSTTKPCIDCRQNQKQCRIGLSQRHSTREASQKESGDKYAAQGWTRRRQTYLPPSQGQRAFAQRAGIHRPTSSSPEHTQEGTDHDLSPHPPSQCPLLRLRRGNLIEDQLDAFARSLCKGQERDAFASADGDSRTLIFDAVTRDDAPTKRHSGAEELARG